VIRYISPVTQIRKTTNGVRVIIVRDDQIYFAGDHCSHIFSWQEGSALLAQRTITMIVGRLNQS
jgi:monoamine oxidase